MSRRRRYGQTHHHQSSSSSSSSSSSDVARNQWPKAVIFVVPAALVIAVVLMWLFLPSFSCATRFLCTFTSLVDGAARRLLQYASTGEISWNDRVPDISYFTSLFERLLKTAAPSLIEAAMGLLTSAAAGSVVTVVILRRSSSDDTISMDVFQKNQPSVVNVINWTDRQGAGGGHTLDELTQRDGTGLGIVWDKDGHIVTSYDVVRGSSSNNVVSSQSSPRHRRNPNSFLVRFSDGSSHRAEVVGWDKDKDLAVLRVSELGDKNLRPLPVGASADLRVGRKVYAIGNPFVLAHALTTGVVSGLHRDIRPTSSKGRIIQDGIQTDASISPGSSGGPLLDKSGKLISIITANGASSGIRFSISIDMGQGIIKQIIKHGKSTRPYIGIKLAPDHSQNQPGHRGVLVYHVDPKSPAQKAGILANRFVDPTNERMGDIIVSINGERVSNSSDLYNLLDKYNVKDQVNVEVQRGAERKTLQVALA